MNYALCSISFRHCLVAPEALVRFARDHRYDGIELWGAHAAGICEAGERRAADLVRAMAADGLSVPMISDYLDVTQAETFGGTLDKCDRLIRLAHAFHAPRIRTFAGRTASRELPDGERAAWAERLGRLSERCASHGVRLLVETHPRTLADGLQSTLKLLSEVGSARIGINFDVLHVWESGADIRYALHVLEPWIDHLHLKNISAPDRLPVFEPGNVYDAAGDRRGMAPLRDGAIDYAEVLEHAAHFDCFASLEWFGDRPHRVLAEEAAWLRSLRPSCVG